MLIIFWHDKLKYNTLYIWVEGPDDSRFFESVFKPLFEKKYQTVEVKEHAWKKNKYIEDFLRSIISMGDEYIFVQDFDSRTCITNVKEDLLSKFSNINENNLNIVKDEIESWYVSGLSRKDSKYFKISYPNNTETLTKEVFDNEIPTKFNSKIDFTREILKRYSVGESISRNSSFAHFFHKYF